MTQNEEIKLKFYFRERKNTNPHTHKIKNKINNLKTRNYRSQHEVTYGG